MSKAKVQLVEDKLTNIYRLQFLSSQLDEISKLKGELPMEVNDLEDELGGLELRVDKLNAGIEELQTEISNHEGNINESQGLIEKYKGQLDTVKNNREFEALTKELEYQGLEMQLSEKLIRQANEKIDAKKETLEGALARVESKTKDLDIKKLELNEIIEKTTKKEQSILKKIDKCVKDVDERLLSAFYKIRNKSKNGLAVVTIVRGTCGGCYNVVPPQIQIEISQKKEIIACENCGRVVVADDIATSVDKIDRTPVVEEPKRTRKRRVTKKS